MIRKSDSIFHTYCRRRGLDAERERQQIQRRQREDALRCRASTSNRCKFKDDLLRELRMFRRELVAVLEGGRR
jgi:hypothetical protein